MKPRYELLKTYKDVRRISGEKLADEIGIKPAALYRLFSDKGDMHDYNRLPVDSYISRNLDSILEALSDSGYLIRQAG